MSPSPVSHRDLATPFRVGIALLVLSGAVVATAFATLLTLLPEENCSARCEDLGRVQLVLAWMGLLPTAVFGAALIRRMRSLADWSFALALICYLVWAVVIVG